MNSVKKTKYNYFYLNRDYVDMQRGIIVNVIKTIVVTLRQKYYFLCHNKNNINILWLCQNR